MKRLPLLLTTALLLASATASDQIRDVQGALKSQGFYYGEVTGTENAETDAAIRRFQIRNGIAVTGKLNATTLAALGVGAKRTEVAALQPGPRTAPQPASQPPPQPAPAVPAQATALPHGEKAPPVKMDAAIPGLEAKDAVQKQLNPAVPAQAPGVARAEKMPPMKMDAAIPGLEAQDAEQKPARRVIATDASVIEPPTPIPAPVSTPFTTMFRGTPYADAPRAVQSEVVRRAQALMAARQFYRGALDGVAGPATSEAIFLFQDGAELRRTGRLDFDTLAEMHLLPPPPPRGGPLLKPFYNPNRHRDHTVSWDFWVR
jgi:peptidoglycan hydrolase-like protein with peptidoglycan-binding domain